MSNAGGGNYPITVEADMHSFDMLPPVVRSALANAKFNMSADAILWKMGHERFAWNIETALTHVRRVERRRAKV